MASTIPTITTLTSVDPTHLLGLLSTLHSATQVAATATAEGDQYSLSMQIAQASASLAIISAEKVMATATGDSQSLASNAILSAATKLSEIAFLQNNYRSFLNLGANIFFCVMFGLAWIYHLIVGIHYRYWYFCCILFCGIGLDFAGYLARALSVHHEDNDDRFLVQIITLTISPAFLMAGVYYMLGRVLVYHGKTFSILRPRWFSYIFITCDVISLVIQAGGGGSAAMSLETNSDSTPGTHTMVAGIAFQVFTMSCFIIIYTHFMYNIYFRCSEEVKFSVKNFFALFFNTKRGRELQALLEPHYDSKYAEVRSRKLYNYTPLAIFLSTALIYIRCIYRVIELAEGWTGYIIRHEVYLFVFDASMVCLMVLVLVPFHPGLLWGRHFVTLKFRAAKKEKQSEEEKEKSADEGDGSLSHEDNNY